MAAAAAVVAVALAFPATVLAAPDTGGAGRRPPPGEPTAPAPDPAKIARLRGHFDAALTANDEAARDLFEAVAAYRGSQGRLSDAEADLDDVRAAAAEARARADETAVIVDERTAALRASQRTVTEAEGAVLRVRDVTGAHAAEIYKHGSTQMGAVESLLRSGALDRLLVHMKMGEAVLEVDHLRVVSLEDELDRREDVVRTRRQRLGHARAAAKRATAEAALVDDLVTALEAAVASARGGVATRAAHVSRLETREAQLAAALDDLQARIVDLKPGLAGKLRGAREARAAARDKDLARTLPFADRAGVRRRPATTPAVLGYACAVESLFIDDWGFPRPGGRTHQGTDMFAPSGTPVLAVAAGRVVKVDPVDTYRAGAVRGDLGGITVTIETDGDETWYYAHLDRVASGLAVGTKVKPRQQLGTVGDSGNARGGAPHVHLGRSIGKVPANPFPAMFVACADVGSAKPEKKTSAGPRLRVTPTEASGRRPA